MNFPHLLGTWDDNEKSEAVYGQELGLGAAREGGGVWHK